MSGTDKRARARLSGGLFSSLKRYLRARNGAVAPLLALSLIPILGAMGMGAEASNWWLTQRSVQNAADTAALAAAINGGTANGGNSTVPTAATSCTTGANAANWYCEAIAAAAKMGYSVSTTVTVTPCAASICYQGTVPTPCSTTSTYKCYEVTVSKKVPIFLLNIVGYHGDSTIGSTHYQTVSASAFADQPGPPLDFCLLTTYGGISASGTPTADLRGCDTFTNGATSCTGNGLNLGADYSTSSATGSNLSKMEKCTASGTSNAFPSQAYECDPYGAPTQTFPYNDGTSGTFSESCPSATNLSSHIPPAPSGCTSSTASTNDGYDGGSSYPSTNIITSAGLNGNATSGSFPGANATTMTIGGTAMQVIQVCGTATLASSANTTSTGAGASCTSTTPALSYSGTAQNLVIIVYNGGLDMNGCTLTNSEPNSTGGGMTVVFAPISATAGSTCAATCYPITHNSANNGGTLAAAGPLSGPFAGLGIMQSADYASDSGCGGGGHGGSVDWCAAGNQPTVSLQGLVYMPNADLAFSGAISKFQATGALQCAGFIVRSFETNGTGAILDSTWGSGSVTTQCQQAGVALPTVSGHKSYYAALVG